ncbi:MAG: hypothetical protein H6585_15185 [Flavobacteriales bacterium]|nr:hypothetical protein [Flavobacteriales bacterium]MCB9449675.1 hypothetical protein [Flavobacteriales bacterium]
MKYLLIAMGAVAISLPVRAQQERSVFSATGRAGVSTSMVTDYQTIGINPANLGLPPKYEGHFVSFGLLESAYSIYSEALTKPDLRKSIRDFNSDDFTYEDKVKAAKEFADAGLSINVDLGLLNLAVQTKKIGGFAFGTRERIQWYSRFNDLTSDILFEGFNADYFTNKIMMNGDTLLASDPNFNPDSVKEAYTNQPKLFSEILDGSRISLSWMREFNFSYGVKLFGIAKDEGDGDKLALYAGAGLKYLSGMAIVDVTADGGQLKAISAVTPAIDIDYGSAGKINPSNLEQGSGFLPKSVGSGMGLDFGVTLTLNDNIKASAAITDIGSMTWNGNVYEARDTSLWDSESAGFNSYNIFSEATEILGDSGMFTWDGQAERKEKLPTVIRLGGSIAFSEKLELGLDAVMPGNDEPGNIEKPVIAVGGDFQALPWLRLSTGLTVGGNYGFNLPAGLVVDMGEGGTWELGVATRDVLTFVSKNNPTLSMAFGFLRFRV